MRDSREYVTQFKQVYSVDCRSALRHIALSALSTFYEVTGQISSTQSKDRVQFLYMHHVFEDEEDSFCSLLRNLSNEYRFISYSEAVDKILRGNIDGSYLAISFDDGLKSCLRAAQIMNEFGIKACFFLCPSMIGEKDYQRIKAFCSRRLHMPPIEFLSWDDVEALLKRRHEIGSHTMTHLDLAQLTRTQLETEIAGSFEILARRIGGVKHFSWPYGRFSNFSPTAASIVFETGYVSCASAERGCHVAHSEKQVSSLCIRRDHVIAKWPVNHILYFMTRNSQTASLHNNLWPPGWRQIIQGGA